MIRSFGFGMTVLAMVAVAWVVAGGLSTISAARAVVTPTPVLSITALRQTPVKPASTPTPANSTPSARPIQPSGLIAMAIPTIPAMMLIAPAEPIPPGAAFDLQVWFSSPVVSRGAQFGLSFDPSKVQIMGIDQGSYYATWATANSAATVMVPA